MSVRRIETYNTIETSGLTRMNVDLLIDGGVADCWRSEAYARPLLMGQAETATEYLQKTYGVAEVIRHGNVSAADFTRLAGRTTPPVGPDVATDDRIVYGCTRDRDAIGEQTVAEMIAQDVTGEYGLALAHIERGEVVLVGGGAAPWVAIWMDCTGEGNPYPTPEEAFAAAQSGVEL